MKQTGRHFIWLVILAGGAVFAHSVWIVTTGPLDWHWLIFAGLTLLGGALTIKVPSLVALLSVSEMFAFTCVLLFGPAPGTLTLVIDGLILSLRRKHRVDRLLFNAAELGISIWTSSHLFFRLAGTQPMYQHATTMGAIILPMAAMTAVYFALNSGLVAIAIGWEFGTHPLTVWRQHFAWLIPNYYAGASVSLLLVLALHQAGLSAIALILPLLLISYLTVRASVGRVEDANQHVAQVDRLYLSTVEALATAIDAKDAVTHDHVRRVQRAAVALARLVGVDDAGTLKAIEAAALLHDTGKLAIPEYILNKPGRLSAAEFDVMKEHARIGAEILSSVEFPYPVVPIVRHHHENWDGTGYPDGLHGPDIPIGARILSVVDCFDALTSDRPYRRRMTDETALGILRERSGTMYDPLIVEAFVSTYRQIMPRVEDSTAPEIRGWSRLGMSSASASNVETASVEHAEEVLALSNLSRALTGNGDLSDVLTSVWVHLRRMVPAVMAGFYSVDRAGTACLRHASGETLPAVNGLRISMGQGVTGWVAANRRVMINSEAVLDLGDAASAAVPVLQSCLSVPLSVGETLVGVVTLYSDKPSAFTEEHARLVQTAAPDIAECFQLALSRYTSASALS